MLELSTASGISLYFEPEFFGFESILLASLGTGLITFFAGFSALYLTEEAK